MYLETRVYLKALREFSSRICKGVMQVWIDTTGHVGTYLFLRIAGARIVAYVHYPTISTDMLARVSRREETFNNSAAIAGSPMMSRAKVRYYKVFAALYGILGGLSDVVLVNSNWTRAHVESIWWGCSPGKGSSCSVENDAIGSQPERRAAGTGPQPQACNNPVTVVFPPCDVSAFAALPVRRKPASCVQGSDQVVLCSVGQFRPEKNQPCALSVLLCMVPHT